MVKLYCVNKKERGEEMKDKCCVTDETASVLVTNIAIPPTRTFTPQKDITAYELAIILPYLVHGTGGYIYWYDNLPPECQRHFTEV
jgi:hypothetical protein